MKIAVVIPTYQRVKKLERCIKSILNQTYKDVEIFVYADDNDRETESFVSGLNNPTISVAVNDTREYVIGSWNKFTRECWDKDWSIMAWIVDDVELDKHCFENAVYRMLTLFSDTDGVIGLSQSCPGVEGYTYKPYGQSLLGRKFISRYPGHAASCPDYIHFWQDQELYTYASSLNKFYHSREAIVKHYHPSFIKEEMDATHSLVRGLVKKKDTETYYKRRQQNLTWGRNFNLINK